MSKIYFFKESFLCQSHQSLDLIKWDKDYNNSNYMMDIGISGASHETFYGTLFNCFTPAQPPTLYKKFFCLYNSSHLLIVILVATIVQIPQCYQTYYRWIIRPEWCHAELV